MKLFDLRTNRSLPPVRFIVAFVCIVGCSFDKTDNMRECCATGVVSGRRIVGALPSALLLDDARRLCVAHASGRSHYTTCSSMHAVTVSRVQRSCDWRNSSATIAKVCDAGNVDASANTSRRYSLRPGAYVCLSRLAYTVQLIARCFRTITSLAIANTGEMLAMGYVGGGVSIMLSEHRMLSVDDVCTKKSDKKGQITQWIDRPNAVSITFSHRLVSANEMQSLQEMISFQQINTDGANAITRRQGAVRLHHQRSRKQPTRGFDWRTTNDVLAGCMCRRRWCWAHSLCRAFAMPNPYVSLFSHYCRFDVTVCVCVVCR